MELFSVREVKDNYKLVDEVAEHHKPVVILDKRNAAVLFLMR